LKIGPQDHNCYTRGLALLHPEPSDGQSHVVKWVYSHVVPADYHCPWAQLLVQSNTYTDHRTNSGVIYYVTKVTDTTTLCPV